MKIFRTFAFVLTPLVLCLITLPVCGQDEKVPPTKEETINWIAKRLKGIEGGDYKQTWTGDAVVPDTTFYNEEINTWTGSVKTKRSTFKNDVKYAGLAGRFSQINFAGLDEEFTYAIVAWSQSEQEFYCYYRYKDYLSQTFKAKDILSVDMSRSSWNGIAGSNRLRILKLNVKSPAKYTRQFSGFNSATGRGDGNIRCEGWGEKFSNSQKVGNTVEIFYLHDSDEDFEKLKKAFLHLRDLANAEDDLF